MANNQPHQPGRDEEQRRAEPGQPQEHNRDQPNRDQPGDQGGRRDERQ